MNHPSSTCNLQIAKVAINLGSSTLQSVFDYQIPQSLQGKIHIGSLVEVEFGSGAKLSVPSPRTSASKKHLGYVVEITSESSFDGKLRLIDRLVSAVPIFDEKFLYFVRSVQNRYAISIGFLLSKKLPKYSVRAEKAFLKYQTQIKEQMRSEYSNFSSFVHMRKTTFSANTFRKLHDTRTRLGEFLLDYAQHVRCRGREWVRPHPGFFQDTEFPMYILEMCAVCVAAIIDAKTAIAVFPTQKEVSTAKRLLQEVLPESLLLDFGNDGKVALYKKYLMAGVKGPKVIFGTRSVCWAPCDADVVLLWDDDHPKYTDNPFIGVHTHPRELALLRTDRTSAHLGIDGQHKAGSVVFMSHNPSLSSRRLVKMGYFAEREAIFPPNKPPKVILAGQMLNESGDTFRISSLAWKAIANGVKTGSVLVQVAKSGYISYFFCRKCKKKAVCGMCGSAYRQLREDSLPECAICSKNALQYRKCATCGGEDFRPAGIGSLRLAKDLTKAFEVNVVVSDEDTEIEVCDKEKSIVVAAAGYEPFVAGGYAACVILDAEFWLSQPGIDATSNSIRIFTNALTLLGRDGVGVIDSSTSAPLLALSMWNQLQFADQELRNRAHLGFPPVKRALQITGTRKAVEYAAEWIKKNAECHLDLMKGQSYARKKYACVVLFAYGDAGNVLRAVKTCKDLAKIHKLDFAALSPKDRSSLQFAFDRYDAVL